MTAAIQQYVKAREKEYGKSNIMAVTLGTLEFLTAEGRFIGRNAVELLTPPTKGTYDATKAALRSDALGSLRGLKAWYEETKKNANDPSENKNILAKLDITISYMSDLVKADKALAASDEPEEGETIDDRPGPSEGETPSRRTKAKRILKKPQSSSSLATAKRLKRALIKAGLAGPVAKKAKADRTTFADITDGNNTVAMQLAMVDSRVDALYDVAKDLTNAAVNSGEEQARLRQQVQDLQEVHTELQAKTDENHVTVTDGIEELHGKVDGLADMMYYYFEGYGPGNDTDMAPGADGVTPPTPSAHANLGSAKPLFPKYTASTDIDIYFDSVERYFRLCGTDEQYHIDYTLLAIPQFSTWWQAHVTAHPLDAHSWDNFKATIKQFLMKEDPHTAAMGKLLRLRQNDMSVADYCTRFMQLVRDSNCQPTDQWLPVHLLQNMNDTSLCSSQLL
jgi:hypothetical protein